MVRYKVSLAPRHTSWSYGVGHGVANLCIAPTSAARNWEHAAQRDAKKGQHKYY